MGENTLTDITQNLLLTPQSTIEQDSMFVYSNIATPVTSSLIKSPYQNKRMRTNSHTTSSSPLLTALPADSNKITP